MGSSIGKFARNGRGVIVLVLAVFVLMPVAFFREVQAANFWAPDRRQEPDIRITEPAADWRKDVPTGSAEKVGLSSTCE